MQITLPERDRVGNNPNTIFRELYRKAQHRNGIIGSVEGSNPALEMNKQDGCYYVTYQEVIKSFLLEGYSESRANKHIDQWIDYDILFVRYWNGFKYIGFSKDVS